MIFSFHHLDFFTFSCFQASWRSSGIGLLPPSKYYKYIAIREMIRLLVVLRRIGAQLYNCIVSNEINLESVCPLVKLTNFSISFKHLVISGYNVVRSLQSFLPPYSFPSIPFHLILAASTFPMLSFRMPDTSSTSAWAAAKGVSSAIWNSETLKHTSNAQLLLLKCKQCRSESILFFYRFPPTTLKPL